MLNKQYLKINVIAAMFSALAIAFATSGCGTPAAKNNTGESESTSEKVEVSTDNTNESSTENTTEEDDNRVLYQSYLNNTLRVEGSYFLEKYQEMIDLYGELQAYYYDVDEDGEKELLINEPSYGFDIFDVKDGSVYLLTCGDGTSAFCSVYEGNGHTYISHSDFSHMGRQYQDLARYDAEGRIVEQMSINAEYFDAEEDVYNENSDFTYNGKPITMKEYEAYMDTYKFVDPDVMEKAVFDMPAPTAKAKTDYNIYEEYYTIVDQADPLKWDGFQLIDLDEDGTPELFATCTNENRPDPGMQPYMIVGYNDQGVVMNDDLGDGVASAGGYRGTLYYLPGTGKLLDSAIQAPLGLPSDTIYEMKDGSINYTQYGGFDVTEYPDDDDYNSWDPMEHGEWNWMNEPVSEDEYKQKFLEATENTSGIAMSEIDYMDKESILKKLKELM
ncbi:hypothetical protein [Butyrivibrio sp. AD3002]|uniref:hypothetical protein n=1 Tax=Butyrivibrio sp. AD3002 TaxID=1280670 RepID=UPI0003B338FD|nr:hypothetical protein [Butyrivibrio sp. AD3002]